MTSAAQTAAPIEGYPELRLLIDNVWRSSPESSPVIDPATERVIARVPHASADDLDDALASTERGFEQWRRMPAAERAVIIRRAAGLLRERRESIARVITLELGKPVPEARAEVDTAAGILEWNADEGRRTYGRIIPGPPDRRQSVLLEPVGPVAAFAPWNAPIITPSRKISSALAAGCSVVIKPAEETPGVAVCLAQAFLDAGLPAGVLTVLFGNPAQISQRLVESPTIRAVTFTGSTAVGKSLAALAGANMTRAVLELGGHAPVLVCADASVERVAAGAAKATMRNAGQVCTSPTRFFVHRRIYDDFVATLTKHVQALRVGNGLTEEIDVGPVATSRRVDAMTTLVEDARANGAEVTTGGRRLPREGYFWEPTVLANVTDDCLVARVEPFGPMAVVASFDDVESALREANRLPFALAGYIFTDEGAAIRRLSADLQCGAIAVNHWQVSGPETPFGGHKDSGLGTEGGSEGITVFQQVKFVSEQ